MQGLKTEAEVLSGNRPSIKREHKTRGEAESFMRGLFHDKAKAEVFNRLRIFQRDTTIATTSRCTAFASYSILPDFGAT